MPVTGGGGGGGMALGSGMLPRAGGTVGVGVNRVQAAAAAATQLSPQYQPAAAAQQQQQLYQQQPAQYPAVSSLTSHNRPPL